MPVRICTLATLALLVAAPAMAQQEHLPKGRVLTMSDPLDVSLKTLLDTGYAIVAGMGGSFTLHNERTGKWVVCQLSDTSFGSPATSTCAALN